MDTEPGSRTGRLAGAAVLLGRPQHGQLVGHGDDAEGQEEDEQPGGEEDYL